MDMLAPSMRSLKSYYGGALKSLLYTQAAVCEVHVLYCKWEALNVHDHSLWL